MHVCVCVCVCVCVRGSGICVCSSRVSLTAHCLPVTKTPFTYPHTEAFSLSLSLFLSLALSLPRSTPLSPQASALWSPSLLTPQHLHFSLTWCPESPEPSRASVYLSLLSSKRWSLSPVPASMSPTKVMHTPLQHTLICMYAV